MCSNLATAPAVAAPARTGFQSLGNDTPAPAEQPAPAVRPVFNYNPEPAVNPTDNQGDQSDSPLKDVLTGASVRALARPTKDSFGSAKYGI